MARPQALGATAGLLVLGLGFGWTARRLPRLGAKRKKRAEEATPFRTLADNAQIGLLVVTPAFTPLYANRRLRTILGLSPETSLEDLPLLTSVLPPNDQIELLALLDQIQSGLQPTGTLTVELIRGDLSTGWFLTMVRSDQWEDQEVLVFSLHDMTEQVLREREMEFNRSNLEAQAADMIALAEATHHERERAEEAQREAERGRRFLHALIATIPSPLYYKDPKGVVLGCNKAFARLYGADSEAEVIGRTVHDLAPAEFAQRTTELDRALFLGGGSVQYERTFTLPDGEERVLIYNKAVFTDDAGASAGVVGIITDISEQKHLEEQLRHLATRDSLTGALNRRAFLDEARRHISRALRHGEPLSVILADIDHFKRINDTHGHAVGDLALRMFVDTVQGRLRESDILGRMGGEEFAIVLPCTPLPDALLLAEVLRQTLAAVVVPSPRGDLSFTVSQGVAGLVTHGRLIDSVLHAADEALYVAKAWGRNRVVAAASPDSVCERTLAPEG
ncbi:sensor domain-containing diguanylate cyclase [Pararhodospirillum photometricum]|nr:sensor domain-containing diguanylate cyclase [Pararhodospirillum photometricum]